MKLLINSLKILTLFSVLFIIQGCQDDEGGILPEVVASFTHNINNDAGVVTFINTSENADTYMWDFGDGTTSTEINPTKIYSTGTYTVVLTAKNAAGASKTFEDVISINIPVPVSLPFNFDGANVVYNYEVFPPGVVSFAIVDNPAPGGSNAAASKVGAITNSGQMWEGMFFDLAQQIDLMNDMTIKFDFWSDTALDVLLKLEQGTGPDTETTASHSGSSEWEELTFTFSSADKFSRMTIFVDGPGTTAGTFYIDNFRQTATVDLTPPVITLVGDNPLNLNVGDTYNDPGATAMDNTDGDITSSIVVGGDTVDTSVETTYTVTYNVMDAAGNAAAEVTRTVIVSALPTSPPAGAPTPTQDAASVVSVYSDSYSDIGTNYDPNWGQSGHMQVNTTFDPGDGNNTLAYPNFNYQGTEVTATDLSAMEFLHVDIWVAAGTDRMVKVSPINGGTGAGEFLVEVPLTPGSWNSVDLPKSAFTGMTWDNVVQMKFDGQFNGDGSANTTTPFDVYLDNIYFYTTTTACTDTDLEIPIDFDCAGIDYPSKQTGDVGFTIVDNPDLSGANPTASKVAQAVFDNNQVWENMFLNLDVPLDFNAGGDIKMKMWSSSMQPVKLKFEDGTGGNIEVDVNHGGTGWEELTFSFTSTDSYNDMVIFVNGGQPTNGTFYFDDIVQTTSGGGGGGTACTGFPVDFESCEAFLSTFNADGSITSMVVANPDMSGINLSANSLEVVKAANTNRWAGFQNPFPSNFDATKTFKFKIRSTKAGAIMRFEINSDPQDPASGNPGPQFHTMGAANTWEEVSIVFTGIPGSNTGVNQLVIKPDNPAGTDGELTSTTETYWFDDIRLE